MFNGTSSASIIIAPENAGLRLDVFLASHFLDTSRSQLQKTIDGEAVLVNGTPAKKKYLLVSGDVLTFKDIVVAHAASSIEPENISLSVVFEDEYFVAINKPAGLVVHPGNGNKSGTLVNALLYHQHTMSDGFSADRPGIVHRLDKNTSGIILVAKTNAAHSAMAKYFQERLIKKEYLGFCLGIAPDGRGSIEVPLGRSKKDPVKRAPAHDGKMARTEYEVIKTMSGISLVRFFPHTGRTHQIRVHSSYRGFPIIADTLYGGDAERMLRIAPLDRVKAYAVFKCFNRQALHAEKVTFVHPFNNKNIIITAPLPEDFKKAIKLFY